MTPKNTISELPSSNGRRNDQFVEAFAKGLQVIRAFPRDKPSATLAELAGAADMPRATVRRMLLTLVELGYAKQTDDRFALKPRLLEIGFVYLNSIPGYRVAQNEIEELAKQLNELCTLSVLDGEESVYVVRAQGRDPLMRSWAVGSRLPAYATSIGRVLMSGLSAQEREQTILRSDLRQLTPRTITDPKALHKAIDQAQRDRYSLVIDEIQLGVSGLAVPVCDRRGNVLAAAGISFNPARFRKKEALETYLPKLRDAAERIGEAMP